MSIVIDAPAGRIRGVRSSACLRFTGIPYAEAPVGALRFAAPKPRARFDEVLDATRPAPTPQRVPLRGAERVDEPSAPGDEILNVSITVPPDAAPGADLPVLVWIHGGSYRGGSPAAPAADATRFADAGIITVHVAYRLGFDGFGHVSDGADDRGLLDIVRALEWVRENVPAFGGDPARVTVGGVSAGAALVLSVLATTRSTGLVSRALALSPTLLDTTRGDAATFAEQLASTIGTLPTAAGFSRIGDDEYLQRRLRDLHPLIGDQLPRGIDAMTAVIPLTPLVGGAVLPVGTALGLAERQADVPLLVGATADEVDAPRGSAVPEQYSSWRVTGDIESAYRQSAGSPRHLVTDVLFRSAPPAVAELRRGGTSPTWLYDFRIADASGRASHGSDVAHWFGNARSAPGVTPDGIAAGELMHADAIAFLNGNNLDWSPDGSAARVYGAAVGLDLTPFARARALMPLWFGQDPDDDHRVIPTPST